MEAPDLLGGIPAGERWQARQRPDAAWVVAERAWRGLTQVTILICVREGRDRGQVQTGLLGDGTLGADWRRWSQDPWSVQVERDTITVQGRLDLDAEDRAEFDAWVDRLVAQAADGPLPAGCWECGGEKDLALMRRGRAVTWSCADCRGLAPLEPLPPVYEVRHHPALHWTFLRRLLHYERQVLLALPLLVGVVAYLWRDAWLTMPYVRKLAKLAMLVSPFVLYGWAQAWQAAGQRRTPEEPSMRWTMACHPPWLVPQPDGSTEAWRSVPWEAAQPGSAPVEDEGRFWLLEADRRGPGGLGGWLVHTMARLSRGPAYPAWNGDVPTAPPGSEAYLAWYRQHVQGPREAQRHRQERRWEAWAADIERQLETSLDARHRAARLVERARLAQRRGDLARAIADYREALACDPDHTDARAELEMLPGVNEVEPIPHKPVMNA
ncbi:MAG TPA: hypothetical protein VGO93_06435 [Candidatus Xenobia bacterium]|jgi:hypothetical protein